MHMVYNSDNFVVVQFDLPHPADGYQGSQALSRGGYEIVDKFAGKETFISGSLAATFRAGVDALIESSPSEEEIDDYLEGFSALMHQPLVLH